MVLLDPLDTVLLDLKEKVDVPVSPDVKEKLVYSEDPETLDWVELREIVVPLVLLDSEVPREILVVPETLENLVVVVSLVLPVTPVPQDNEEEKEMVVLPVLLDHLVKEVMMV